MKPCPLWALVRLCPNITLDPNQALQCCVHSVSPTQHSDPTALCPGAGLRDSGSTVSPAHPWGCTAGFQRCCPGSQDPPRVFPLGRSHSLASPRSLPGLCQVLLSCFAQCTGGVLQGEEVSDRERAWAEKAQFQKQASSSPHTPTPTTGPTVSCPKESDENINYTRPVTANTSPGLSFWLKRMYLHHPSVGWFGQKISTTPRHSNNPKFCCYLQEVSK